MDKLKSEQNALLISCFLIILGIIMLAYMSFPARARDNGAWEATSEEVRKWYQGLMQPDAPRTSCCGEADAYHADSFEECPPKTKDCAYIAVITDERPMCNPGKIDPPQCVQGRPYVPVGTKIRVPPNKLKYDDGNPTGHGVVFITYDSENEDWRVLCYVVPGGV